MNALLKPTLTDSERARIRKELYEEKIKDYPFILEALGEASARHVNSIKEALANRDSIWLLMEIDALIHNHIESELAEDAERELLGSKDVNGPNWNTA
jgi:uncharacterized Zn finger protein